MPTCPYRSWAELPLGMRLRLRGLTVFQIGRRRSIDNPRYPEHPDHVTTARFDHLGLKAPECCAYLNERAWMDQQVVA